MSPGPIPVTVVTGFLGSGKTTLLNRLLVDGGLGRVAALVNDFGAIDIDAALVAEVADEVVQLSNGCICCTINGDLLAAVEKTLSVSPAVDRIVVETTGLADPLPVGLTFLQTELRSRCTLEAMVTVVDCANFALDLFDAGAAMAQIVHGDVIVLNKSDLVTPERIRELENRIALIKPRARRIVASYGRVPMAALVSVSDEPPLTAFAAAGRSDGHAHLHLADDGFEAHAFALDGPISAAGFQAWLDEGLPESVFRAKGILRFDGPEQLYLFQFCGGRASFEPFVGAAGNPGLVFIGRGIDEASIARRVHALTIAPSPVAEMRAVSSY